MTRCSRNANIAARASPSASEIMGSRDLRKLEGLRWNRQARVSCDRGLARSVAKRLCGPDEDVRTRHAAFELRNRVRDGPYVAWPEPAHRASRCL